MLFIKNSFIFIVSMTFFSCSSFAQKSDLVPIINNGIELLNTIEYFPKDKKFEPSGLSIDVDGTVWVVSDNGRIGIINETTKSIDSKRMNRKGDYEGITFGPNGNIFLAEEGSDNIVKFNNNGTNTLQIYNIKRKYKGKKVISKKGNGLESLDYYKEDTNNWYFITTNQSKNIATNAKDFFGTGNFNADFFGDVNMDFNDYTPDDTKDASAILVIAVSKYGKRTKIVEYYPVNIEDMSGVFYSKGNLFIISDKQNALFHFKKNCCGITLLSSYSLIGQDQEGIVIDKNGDLYIAQDSGSVLKLVLKNKFKLKDLLSK